MPGYFVADSAATAFFYLLTAVHGLHGACGLRGVGPRIGQGMAGNGPGQHSGSASSCRDPTGITCSPSVVVLYALLVWKGRSGDLLVGRVVTAYRKESRSRTS